MRPAVKILVIDDGSADATAEEARQAGGMVVSLPFNLGIGAAVQTGFQYAQKYQYDIAVQIDGDGQHDPAFVDKIVEPILRDDADGCMAEIAQLPGRAIHRRWQHESAKRAG